MSVVAVEIEMMVVVLLDVDRHRDLNGFLHDDLLEHGDLHGDGDGLRHMDNFVDWNRDVLGHFNMHWHMLHNRHGHVFVHRVRRILVHWDVDRDGDVLRNGVGLVHRVHFRYVDNFRYLLHYRVGLRHWDGVRNVHRVRHGDDLVHGVGLRHGNRVRHRDHFVHNFNNFMMMMKMMMMMTSVPASVEIGGVNERRDCRQAEECTLQGTHGDNCATVCRYRDQTLAKTPLGFKGVVPLPRGMGESMMSPLLRAT